MQGKGAELLARNLNSLKSQTLVNFEVVVSDNSDDDSILNECRKYKNTININYSRNRRKGITQNTNASLKKSNGKLLKILYMDDFMASNDSLQKIVDNFEKSGHWLVTGCEHSNDGKTKFKPHPAIFDERIFKGINTIGSPSVLTIRKRGLIYFDEKMTWLLDCDFYIRLFHKYGKPTILDDLNVVIGLGKHQMTNILTDEEKRSELDYFLKKEKV